jgi:hypothetical protein
MKKVYLMLVLNSLFTTLSAQSFEWAKREGRWAYDYGYGIASDMDGNVYVAGKYEGDSDFSGTTVVSAGNHDAFLAKYSSAGSLTWIRTAGGVNGDYAHSLATDGTNYIYVAGEVEGSGDIVSFPGSSITLTTVGDNDIYLAKYDMDGTLLWAKSAAGYGGEKALDVAYDTAGNVYICGYYTDPVMFNSSNSIAGMGLHDMFLAKYDANGNLDWVKHAGGPGRDEALSVACDQAGNVYVGGMHKDSAVFESVVLASPNGHLNAFIAKYASDGTMSWVKSYGEDYDDVVWSLAVDNSGDLLASGEFIGYVLFDATALTSVGACDVFVTKLDGSGNVVWAKQAGGMLVDRARGLGTDGTNVYITGQYGSTANFGSYPLVSADSSDVFMASLNSSGDFRWATSVGGVADSVETLGYESGIAISADASGYVYATGSVLDGGVFGSTTYDEYGRADIFVAKLAQVGAGVNVQEIASGAGIYPNPATSMITLQLDAQQYGQAEVCIYNAMGQCVYTHKNTGSSKLEIDLTAKERGMYFLQLRTASSIHQQKIILQ